MRQAEAGRDRAAYLHNEIAGMTRLLEQLAVVLARSERPAQIVTAR